MDSINDFINPRIALCIFFSKKMTICMSICELCVTVTGKKLSVTHLQD